MSNIQLFNHEVFGKIRVMLLNDEPIFNLYDVAFSLGYTRENGIGVLYIRKDKLINICESLGIKGVTQGVTDIPISKETDFESTYISEGDLYDLTLESKTKNAKGFRKWITHEVIPTIRKTGGYVANDDLFINIYLPFADDQTKMMFRGVLETVRKQNEQIAAMKPKADYFDALVDRNLLTNFRDTAKELKVKERFFIDWLLRNKFVYRDQKGKLKPYAPYVPSLFEMKEFTRNGKADVQTLITPKGRETFRLLLQKEVAVS
ncbi:phage antirepressor KilAC domain-containing protein [Aeribacillus alveayuensis]|uniref:phage antirepressor KilAC domain-containing protein n=1 Tax=Aeribacillus alveayuensis TaxID=279215 RepID=UPI0005D0F57C|nr:phage antirepressor KilAC domain-containing protein [Bacillus alveayuensis]